MNESFWLMRAAAALPLRTGAPSGKWVNFLRRDADTRKSVVQALVDSGVPLRYFLTPYVDTVLLDARTPSFYFGGRILVLGVPTDAQRRIARDAGLTVAVARNADELRARLRIRAVRADISAVPDDESAPELVHYTFPAGRVDPARCPMELRAQARAVLAFGEILSRVVARAGGEILRCAEDELLIAWPAGEPEAMTQTIQSTYASQLAAVLGGAVRMQRRVYPGGDLT